ncbi:MAG: amidase family protein [Myxococcota bacterium]
MGQVSDPPIHARTARELLRAMDDGELSSRALVEALHHRADAVEPSINALVQELREEALARADEADEARGRGERWGPLHGLPITIKENVETRGLPSTLGMRARRALQSTADAAVVRVAREAGAIILAKTNVPQTLLSPMETTNALWGTTRNPWSLDHGPGGSSGGEGAALASGTSVLGIGTDIGGSIRSPATFCGVAGLKPTGHRWSNRGSRTALVGQEVIRSQIGPMARTADDVALLFQALDPLRQAALDPSVPPLPVPDPAAVDVSALRIGVYEDDGFFRPAAAVRRAVREAADALERAGAEILPYEPPNVQEVVDLYFAALSSDGMATLREALDGEPIIDPLKTMFRIGQMPAAARRGLRMAARAMRERRLANLLAQIGEKSVADLWRLSARRTELGVEEARAWNDRALDAVVCPASVTPACPHGTSHDFTLGICYVARYNLLNMPAGVVPVTRVRADELVRDKPRDRLDRRAAQIEAASAGLPVGVQVAGRPWREEVVLAVMRAIETRVRDGRDFPRTPVDPVGSQELRSAVARAGGRTEESAYEIFKRLGGD